MSAKIYPLFAMGWTEFERGWGSRPDGYSFHASIEEYETFWNAILEARGPIAPNEYSQPNTDHPQLVMVSESLFNYVAAHGSVWLAPNDPDSYKTYDASDLFRRKIRM